MQYMLMCCCDEKTWTQLRTAKHRIMQYGALIQSLVTSRTVSWRGTAMLASSADGAHEGRQTGAHRWTVCGAKEQLGGYRGRMRDLDEAPLYRNAFRHYRREARSSTPP